jgi:hypothetical protein
MNPQQFEQIFNASIPCEAFWGDNLNNLHALSHNMVVCLNVKAKLVDKDLLKEDVQPNFLYNELEALNAFASLP